MYPPLGDAPDTREAKSLGPLPAQTRDAKVRLSECRALHEGVLANSVAAAPNLSEEICFESLESLAKHDKVIDDLRRIN